MGLPTSSGLHVRPRIIIHGGAGNIRRENLSDKAYQKYKRALLEIIKEAHYRLSLPGATALDVATFAVSQLEDHELFNAGHGAVFTTSGSHELEASVMVSRGYRKRGVGVMGITKVRNPILLAREMLVRGEQIDGGGARLHNQLHGAICEDLAAAWKLDLVKPSYFWTRRRWDEHRRGLGLSHDKETYERHRRQADGEEDSELPECRSDSTSSRWLDCNDPAWDGHEYLPQGTVGAVVLDSSGVLCVATSTGGLTNKLPGRIGDTPTLGAGFWAEEWHESSSEQSKTGNRSCGSLFSSIRCVIRAVLARARDYDRVLDDDIASDAKHRSSTRAVAVSGTGNGDSFLRTSAARTTAAIAQFAAPIEQAHGIPHKSTTTTTTTLRAAVHKVVGRGGALQESAGDHWGVTGEGEGGMIGIDFAQGKGSLAADFNCGGMFRAWIDEHNQAHMAVFRDEDEAMK